MTPRINMPFDLLPADPSFDFSNPAKAPPSPNLPSHFPLIASVTFVAAVVYLVGIIQHSFWGENEAYYALGAKSVLRGQLLLPSIYNEMLADKPPFIFWWIAMVSAVFGGVTEVTARLANLLPSVALIALVVRFGRIYAGSLPALMAGIILATCYEFWENALEVNTDMMLSACLFLSWSMIFAVMEQGFTRIRWLLIWVPLAVAMLTKGPVASALSCLAACGFAFSNYGWRQGWQKLMALRPFTGAAVCLTPFLLWLASVWMVHGWAPLNTILFKHNVQRFVEAFDHQKPWYYYVKELPVNLLPWSVAIPYLAWRMWAWRKAGESLAPWQKFAGCATLAIFAFFSFSSSKRDYYLLPLMPWMALLLGVGLSRICEEFTGRHPARHWKLIAGTGAFLMAGLAAYFAVALPQLDKKRSVKPLVTETEKALDSDDQLVLFAAEDPRIMYYLKERFAFYDDTAAGQQSMDELFVSDPQGDLDILLPLDSLKRMKKVASVPLFIEGSAQFRDDKFFILTTETNAGFPLLTSEFILREKNSSHN